MVVGCDLAVGTLAPAKKNAETTPPLTVNVARAVLSENVAETSSSFGTIQPRRSSSLGFARAGRVSKVLFEVGDLVGKGDKIAELDQGELVNQQEDLDFVLQAQNEELKLLESSQDVQGFRRKEEEIAELTNQQKRLTREFEKGFIVAPYRGVLAERSAEVGDAVPAGRPFFRILEAGQPVVELSVPVSIANQISVGTEVWVKRGEKGVGARVATKAPELDASSRTQSLTLEIVDKDKQQPWNYGEVVEVQFLMPTDRDGFWLPYSALHKQANGLWCVYVLEQRDEQQIVSPRRVELHQLADRRALAKTKALVSGTLSAGDLFVVDGLNRIVPGQVVLGNVVGDDYLQADTRGAGE